MNALEIKLKERDWNWRILRIYGSYNLWILQFKDPTI